MLSELLRDIFAFGREASLVSYLLFDLVFHAYALHKEWLVLGKTALRDRAACEAKDKALNMVNDKLTEQRILNERATVTLDSLKEHVRALELSLARYEGSEHVERRHR
jgi:hypothetical protein